MDDNKKNGTTGRGMAIAFILVSVFLAVTGIARFIINGTIKSCVMEIVTLLLIFLSLAIFTNQDNRLDVDKKLRKKDYFLCSLGFSAGLVLIGVVSFFWGGYQNEEKFAISGLSIAGSFALYEAIAFVAAFIVSYITSYFIGERKHGAKDEKEETKTKEKTKK